MSSPYFQASKLEVDSDLLESTLNFNKTSSFSIESQTSLMKTLVPSPNYSSVDCTPSPGLCVKTKNSSGKKVFINLCKISEIPPGPPLSEEELVSIIQDENYESPFRVPMSLGAPVKEESKSGEDCLKTDVAINSYWFEEHMEPSIALTTFVINLAMEGLFDKYGESVNLDRNGWVILKNKKYHGKLQRHKIQKREQKVKEIAELNETSKTPLVSEITEISKVSPKVKLMKEPLTGIPQKIFVEVSLPGVYSANDISVEIGEDRIILETQRYFYDAFLPYNMIPDKTSAQFNKENSILSVTATIKK